MANRLLCKIADCGKPFVVRGFCESHYRRFLRHGDPRAGQQPPGVKHAFIENLKWRGVQTCILWPYSTSIGGYGQTTRYRGTTVAHRVSLMMHKGMPPKKGLQAAHEPIICHNRLCVNPNHLSWKTPKQNSQDRFTDGTAMIGARNHKTKLSERDILDIQMSSETCTHLAGVYGVCHQTISKVKRRRAPSA